MSTKTVLETSGSAFDYTTPPGRGPGGEIAKGDDALRELKESVQYRMAEEHNWQKKSDVIDITLQGTHKPSSGRCDTLTWSAVTASVDYGSLYPSRKAGALFKIADDVSAAGQVGRVVYHRRSSDGVLVPLIKALRGLIWVHGGLVFQKLLDPHNNRVINTTSKVTTSDQDGVANGAANAFGHLLFIPYPDGGRNVFPLKVWNGDPEKFILKQGHIPSSDEAFAFDFEDYGGPDKGVRMLMDKDGIEFVVEAGATSDKMFDGIKVGAHDHSGGDLGTNLPYTAIDNTDGDRITFHKTGSLTKTGFALDNANWIKLGTISAANCNPVGTPTDALRELVLILKVTEPAPGSANFKNDTWNPVPLAVAADGADTIPTTGLTPYGVAPTFGIVCGGMSTSTCVIPLVPQANGGPGAGNPLAVYVRLVNISEPTVGMTVQWISRIWRR